MNVKSDPICKVLLNEGPQIVKKGNDDEDDMDISSHGLESFSLDSGRG